MGWFKKKDKKDSEKKEDKKDKPREVKIHGDPVVCCDFD